MKVCSCHKSISSHVQCEECEALGRTINKEYTSRQFEIHKTYALYWQAMAITGAATMRELQQGREPTPEEKDYMVECNNAIKEE